jgi:Transposase
MNSGKASERREVWKERIARQEKSGESVRAFCKEHGLQEHSFYGWRKRLQPKQPVTFALVETIQAKAATGMTVIELVLPHGDRLRIPSDAATLRTVLSVLRERP